MDQFAANGLIDTHPHAHTHPRASLSHCGSRLVQLLLGSDINTEQIGGDLQPLLFDLSSSCHISWHCPPATLRGAGRTGMASTRLPGLFSVFFLVQLIPLCPLHGCSSANYKSSPTPSDSPHLRERFVLIPASAQDASRGGSCLLPRIRLLSSFSFPGLVQHSLKFWTEMLHQTLQVRSRKGRD